MIAAIDNFNQEIQDNKIMILGDMLELGDFSRDEHSKIIDYLSKMNVEAVYLVGQFFSSINISESKFKKFSDTEELIKSLDLTKVNNKNILIKGSRSIGLEKLII